jgi:NAD-dependent deacetylase
MTFETEINIPPDLLRRFECAESVLVLTGAGISAESGVPTFRGGGNTAVWKGMPFDVISSASMVQQNLAAVWEWFDYRRGVLLGLAPNEGHHAIAQWERLIPKFTLVTQNVDGLHQKAGSQSIIELHGNIWRARCTSCETRYAITPDVDRADLCVSCGDPLRPDIVLFGEFLPAGAFELAAERASSCDLCFVVGTSSLVYPAASLPELAKAAGAYLCEINPEPTPLSHLCDVTIRGKAGEVLPLISNPNKLSTAAANQVNTR